MWGQTEALERCMRHYPNFDLNLARMFVTLASNATVSTSRSDPSTPLIPRHLLQLMFQSRPSFISNAEISALYQGKAGIPRRVVTPEPRWFAPRSGSTEVQAIYNLLVEYFGKNVYGDGSGPEGLWWSHDDVMEAVAVAHALEQADCKESFLPVPLAVLTYGLQKYLNPSFI
ncbi:hypothetical protein HDU93_002542 [Gonapodya sp. JEL0774]|nr:hypothetical protein HDU93_002542 [Gonapodya sp. JEL0774]